MHPLAFEIFKPRTFFVGNPTLTSARPRGRHLVPPVRTSASVPIVGILRNEHWCSMRICEMRANVYLCLYYIYRSGWTRNAKILSLWRYCEHRFTHGINWRRLDFYDSGCNIMLSASITTVSRISIIDSVINLFDCLPRNFGYYRPFKPLS